MFSNISAHLHIKWGSRCIMHGNVCALSLFLTRGPYARLLAGAGEKSPGCLILLNKRDQAACRRLHGPCQSLLFFFLCWFFFYTQPPPSPFSRALLAPRFDYAAKHTRTVTQETGSPRRPSLPVSLFVVLALIPPDCNRST